MNEAIRTATLWFEQQIENAKQDQISGFRAGPQVRGERAHARHCALYEAQQVFLEAVRASGDAQTPLMDLERFCIAFTWAYGTALERKNPGTVPDDGHTPETLWMAPPEEDREFIRGVMRDAFAAYSVSSTHAAPRSEDQS